MESICGYLWVLRERKNELNFCLCASAVPSLVRFFATTTLSLNDEHEVSVVVKRNTLFVCSRHFFDTLYT